MRKWVCEGKPGRERKRLVKIFQPGSCLSFVLVMNPERWCCLKGLGPFPPIILLVCLDCCGDIGDDLGPSWWSVGPAVNWYTGATGVTGKSGPADEDSGHGFRWSPGSCNGLACPHFGLLPLLVHMKFCSRSKNTFYWQTPSFPGMSWFETWNLCLKRKFISINQLINQSINQWGLNLNCRLKEYSLFKVSCNRYQILA